MFFVTCSNTRDGILQQGRVSRSLGGTSEVQIGGQDNWQQISACGDHASHLDLRNEWECDPTGWLLTQGFQLTLLRVFHIQSFKYSYRIEHFA